MGVPVGDDPEHVGGANVGRGPYKEMHQLGTPVEDCPRRCGRAEVGKHSGGPSREMVSTLPCPFF